MTDERLYSIDTSALIDGLERYYPEEAFPGLWEKVEKLVEAGRLFMSEEVWEECRARDLAVKVWCERVGKDALVIPTDARVTIAVQAILGRFPRITMQMKGRNRADPFVIAVAKMRGAVAVTGEGADGTVERPKIPFVCSQVGVQCVRFLDILKLEGWRF